MLDRIRPETLDAEAEQILGALDFSDPPAVRDASGHATPRQVFELVFPRAYAERGELQERIRGETAGGSVRWIISGEGGGDWSIHFDEAQLAVDRDDPAPTTATIRVNVEDFGELRRGELQPQAALMAGRIKVTGNLGFLLNHPCVIPL